MVGHYVLTLSGSAQALSSASGSPPDRAVRTVSLQPGASNAAAVYVGDADVSDSDYGVRLEAASGGVPPAPFMLGETQSQVGHFKLSDLYVLGSNTEKLHLLVTFV